MPTGLWTLNINKHLVELMRYSPALGRFLNMLPNPNFL